MKTQTKPRRRRTRKAKGPDLTVGPVPLTIDPADPRRLEAELLGRRMVGTIESRLTLVLDADTERAELSPGWTAEAPPAEWPAAADDFFYSD